MGYQGLGIIPILLLIIVPIVLVLSIIWIISVVVVLIALIRRKPNTLLVKIASAYLFTPFVLILMCAGKYGYDRLCYFLPVKDYDQIYLGGGTFTMGDSKHVDTVQSNFPEAPVHEVTVSPFFMDESEVTIREYDRLMGKRKNWHRYNPKTPVGNITWSEALLYCNERSKSEGKDTAYIYRPPAGKFLTMR